MKKERYSSRDYLFPLSIQIELPENFRSNNRFLRHLKLLQEFGFYGVELNIADPAKADIKYIQDFFLNFNLKITMLASGLTAKVFDLSLSTSKESIRKRSIHKCKELIDFVAGTKVGIIVGFLKGALSPDSLKVRQLFTESLTEINDYAVTKKVKILIEATNKKETSVINTLAEAVELVTRLNSRYLEILPDTYHMNIEEQDGFNPLQKYKNYYRSLHISDNNRFFPGLGTIQFDVIFNLLRHIEYKNGVAIEGRIKNSFAQDLKDSMEYLIPLLTSVPNNT